MNFDAIQNAAGQPLAVLSSPVPPGGLPEQRELIQAVRALNAADLFGHNYELALALDRQTRRPAVRLVHRKTREVLREIPPQYVLERAADLERPEDGE